VPARDLYHNAVKAALLSDGWVITHDPYHVAFGGRDVYIDLGAQREALDVVLAAERGLTRIAVEIKTFGAIRAGGLAASIGAVRPLPDLAAYQ